MWLPNGVLELAKLGCDPKDVRKYGFHCVKISRVGNRVTAEASDGRKLARIAWDVRFVPDVSGLRPSSKHTHWTRFVPCQVLEQAAGFCVSGSTLDLGESTRENIAMLRLAVLHPAFHRRAILHFMTNKEVWPNTETILDLPPKGVVKTAFDPEHLQPLFDVCEAFKGVVDEIFVCVPDVPGGVNEKRFSMNKTNVIATGEFFELQAAIMPTYPSDYNCG